MLLSVLAPASLAEDAYLSDLHSELSKIMSPGGNILLSTVKDGDTKAICVRNDGDDNNGRSPEKAIESDLEATSLFTNTTKLPLEECSQQAHSALTHSTASPTDMTTK